jgi:hypothetical protein
LAAVWIVGLVAVGCAASLTSCESGPRRRNGASSSAIFVPGPDVAPAPSFRVVYRVDDTAGPQPFVSTDVLQVRRPFEARLEHRLGAPPGGTIKSSTVENVRFRINASDNDGHFATRRVPGPLSEAPSPDVLEAAVAAGVAERVGDGAVANERCIRYLYRQAGNEILARPDERRRVEACVTPDGILVREAIRLEGRQVRVVEAVDVDRHPRVERDTFMATEDPDSTELLETAQLVSEGKAPKGSKLVEVPVPTGFRTSSQATVNRQPGENSPMTAFFVASYQRGTEILAVEQLLTAGAEGPWPQDEGSVVDVGHGRSVRVLYRAAYIEVRLAPGGHLVRVMADRAAVALAVARSLAA